jgi:hypothetical protein
MLHVHLLNFDDRIFKLKKKIREDLNPIIDSWKEELHADTVLRKDGFFWFCEQIQDVEIINTDNDERNNTDKE